MALHEPPSVDVEDVKEEVHLDPDVFEWDSRDQRELDERVQGAINRETAYVKAKIGSGQWATADEDQKELIKGGILWRTCAAMLRQVINIISHHPEHVTSEVADLASLESSISDYQRREIEYLGEMYDSVEDYSPQVVWAMGGDGVDERETTSRLPHLAQETDDEVELENYYLTEDL